MFHGHEDEGDPTRIIGGTKGMVNGIGGDSEADENQVKWKE